MTNAVDICINGNILKDILTDQKSEVIQMILETYDEELHNKTLKQEGYLEGLNTGICNLISTLQELNLSREKTLAKIQEKYDLSPEDAESYMLKYWKE